MDDEREDVNRQRLAVQRLKNVQPADMLLYSVLGKHSGNGSPKSRHFKKCALSAYDKIRSVQRERNPEI
ncbi:MAG TPA: hypothetical protein PLT28_00165 [Saprospiraceae bacterium]|nr:hypothetical protein [Saprospiraceae bacterium]